MYKSEVYYQYKGCVVNVFKEINLSINSLLNTDFTSHVLLYLIQCNFSKICSLLALVSNA